METAEHEGLKNILNKIILNSHEKRRKDLEAGIFGQLLAAFSNKGEIAVETLGKIQKSSLIDFYEELDNSFAQMKHSGYEVGFDEKFSLLKAIINFIEEQKENNINGLNELNKYYNYLFYYVLFDIYLKRVNEMMHEIKMERNFDLIMENKNYRHIFHVLSHYKFLSHSDWARKSGISTQNLANYLSKLRDKNIFISYKSPLDKKSTLYCLTYDFMEFIKRDNNALLWEEPELFFDYDDWLKCDYDETFYFVTQDVKKDLNREKYASSFSDKISYLRKKTEEAY